MVALTSIGSIRRSIAAPLRLALDTALPPRCLMCTEPMAPPGGLCPDCWPAVSFLESPLCEKCGMPLADGQAVGPACGVCHASDSPLSRTRAAMVYDDASRDLVLRLKHADALAGVPTMARWMQRAGAELLAEADLLIPVPLHWSRLFMRRYNQSAELARAISRLSGKPSLPLALARHRRTPSQGGLDRQQRHSNTEGAFSVPSRYSQKLTGKSIILIDDVMTTGATLEACARVLAEAGARQIDALTLARVPHGGPLS